MDFKTLTALCKKLIIEYSMSGEDKSKLEEYNTILEEHISKLSSDDIKSLKRRKDYRGYFTFFWHIYKNTKKEQEIMRLWAKSLGTVKYSRKGVDNDGFPIICDDNFHLSDFEVNFDGQTFDIDLKVSPTMKCFTFKESCLKDYHKRDISILLVLCQKTVPKTWAIIDKKIIKMMIDGELGTSGNHFGGYKKTIRVNCNNNDTSYQRILNENLIDFKEFNI